MPVLFVSIKLLAFYTLAQHCTLLRKFKIVLAISFVIPLFDWPKVMVFELLCFNFFFLVILANNTMISKVCLTPLFLFPFNSCKQVLKNRRPINCFLPFHAASDKYVVISNIHVIKNLPIKTFSVADILVVFWPQK